MPRAEDEPRFDSAPLHDGVAAAREPDADLAAPATQIVRDREDYLGQGSSDLGRRVSDEQVELFVGGAAPLALQQQLQRQAPSYIALHDVGAASGLKLLLALAEAAGARVQRLSIRRQGHGVALAVVPFVEIAGAAGAAPGRPLRVYSTDIEAVRGEREALGRVLLSHATLAVLMVAELPPATLAQALSPLHQAIAGGPWPNRELLLLPMGSATALAGQAALLGRAVARGRDGAGGGPTVRVTPHAGRPNEAWAYISGTWNRLLAGENGRVLDTDLQRAVPPPAVPRSEAPTQAMPLDALPSARAARHPAAPGLVAAAPSNTAAPRFDEARRSAPRVVPAVPAGPAPADWADYLLRCAALRGTQAGAVFDVPGRRLLGRFGSVPADTLIGQGLGVLEAASAATRALGFAEGLPESTTSVGEQHLLVRPLPTHPGLVLLLVLQAGTSHLTLVKLQLERLATPRG